MEQPKYSRKISAGTRVYFVDVHTDAKEQQYITLSELSVKEPNNGSNPDRPKRQTIYIHKANMTQVAKAIEDAINFINAENG